MPKNNAEFWKAKFERNVERDQEKLAALKTDGWKSLVIWECELKKDLATQVAKVQALIENN